MDSIKRAIVDGFPWAFSRGSAKISGRVAPCNVEFHGRLDPACLTRSLFSLRLLLLLLSRSPRDFGNLERLVLICGRGHTLRHIFGPLTPPVASGWRTSARTTEPRSGTENNSYREYFRENNQQPKHVYCSSPG